MVLVEWDEARDKLNRLKHGISFAEAMLVFADPYALADQDRIESGERRWQTIGLVGRVAVLLVAHTVREEGPDEIIRLISARRANRKERMRYEENREKNAY